MNYVSTVYLAMQTKVSVALIERIAEHMGIGLKQCVRSSNMLPENAVTNDEATSIRFFMLHNRDELHRIIQELGYV